MKQEDKELLLKDLSARLPYNIKLNVDNHIVTLFELDKDLGLEFYREDEEVGFCTNIEYAKPYLRPLSSMTDEEKEELSNTVLYFELEHISNEGGFNVKAARGSAFEIDFYNSHHLDYRGLIPKGLALEAEEGMYN